MEFNMNFTIIAVCNHFRNDDKEFLEKDIKIELSVDKKAAANFIFRFAPSVFDLGSYKVVLKFDEMNVIKGIALIQDENIYVVKNMNQVLSDLTEGFIRTRTTEKLVSIMEFDFETALQDADGIVDEFDLKTE